MKRTCQYMCFPGKLCGESPAPYDYIGVDGRWPLCERHALQKAHPSTARIERVQRRRWFRRAA